jgi:hypothetical protein
LKCPYIIEWRNENGKRREKSLGTNDWEPVIKLVNKMVLSGDKGQPNGAQPGQSGSDIALVQVAPEKEICPRARGGLTSNEKTHC